MLGNEASELLLNRLFTVYCAIPSTIDLVVKSKIAMSLQAAKLGEVVGRDELERSFQLNKYTIDWKTINNEKAATVGAATNFRVDIEEELAFDYLLESCKISGIRDDGRPVEYLIKDNQCLSEPLSASQADNKSLTFKMCAFGTTPYSLESMSVSCRVRLCITECRIFTDWAQCDPGYKSEWPSLVTVPLSTSTTSVSTTTATSPASTGTTTTVETKTTPLHLSTTTSTTTSTSTKLTSPESTSTTSTETTTTPKTTQAFTTTTESIEEISHKERISRRVKCRERVLRNPRLKARGRERQLTRCATLP